MLRRLRLGVSEDEKATLSNEKIEQVDLFTYLDIIISKDGGSREDIENRTARAHDVLSQLNKLFGRIER
jgi:hypothetical protein